MILVDTAAGSSSLLSYPPLSSIGIPGRLPSPPSSDTRADAMFYGCGPGNTEIKVGIEVKEVTELATALDTGRLQATQLPGLLSLYHVRWLVVITGSHRRNPETGALQTLRTVSGHKVWLDWIVGKRGTVQFNFVHKFLSSPSFTEYKDDRGEGIRHVCVFDKREAAAWIGDLYDTWQRPYSKHNSMRVLDRSGNQNGLSESTIKSRLAALHDPRLSDPKFAQRVRTASSLPHVSYTRAVALAEEFGSVQEMISPECWCRATMGEEEREREERRWSEVATKDSETGKRRRLGVSLAKDIAKAVR